MIKLKQKWCKKQKQDQVLGLTSIFCILIMKCSFIHYHGTTWNNENWKTPTVKLIECNKHFRCFDWNCKEKLHINKIFYSTCWLSSHLHFLVSFFSLQLACCCTYLTYFPLLLLYSFVIKSWLMLWKIVSVSVSELNSDKIRRKLNHERNIIHKLKGDLTLY